MSKRVDHFMSSREAVRARPIETVVHLGPKRQPVWWLANPLYSTGHIRDTNINAVVARENNVHDLSDGKWARHPEQFRKVLL